jgi:co-chaperonin GroES (HSP10)
VLEHHIGRIYQNGFKAEDFLHLQPGLVVVTPVRPPSVTLGGIHTSVDWAKMPAPRCVLHKVTVVGPQDESYDGSKLDLAVGDVVVIRTAMAEPVHPELEPLLVHCRHVLAKVGEEKSLA